jgi:Tfp pilus assembly protein PilV
MKFGKGKLKAALIATAICLAAVIAVLRFETRSVAAQEQSAEQSILLQQSQADVDRKSAGCISCHTSTDAPTMHQTGTVRLACADCHGGNPEISVPSGSKPGSAEYNQAKLKAHPHARFAEDERSSDNPVRAYTRWLKEDPQYIQFVNPGDLRIADRTCGLSGCHTAELKRVRTSMMTHGAMLWGAALYNNGSYPLKDPHFGESYDRNGVPQRMDSVPAPTPEETRTKGVLPYLEPLERW